MMENKEIEILHRINKGLSVLMVDLNEVVKDISLLTELVYNREIENIPTENNNVIKLHSHM